MSRQAKSMRIACTWHCTLFRSLFVIHEISVCIAASIKHPFGSATNVPIGIFVVCECAHLRDSDREKDCAHDAKRSLISMAYLNISTPK